MIINYNIITKSIYSIVNSKDLRKDFEDRKKNIDGDGKYVKYLKVNRFEKEYINFI